jgi:hypothetical protein
MNLKISVVVYTGCPRDAKKLHNLFVIKDINFYFFLDDSYANNAHSENSVSQYYKNTKVALFLPEFRIAGVSSKIRSFQIVAHKLK